MMNLKKRATGSLFFYLSTKPIKPKPYYEKLAN